MRSRVGYSLSTIILMMLIIWGIQYVYGVKLQGVFEYAVQEPSGYSRYDIKYIQYGYTTIYKDTSVLEGLVKLDFSLDIPKYADKYAIAFTLFSFVNPNKSINILLNVNILKGSVNGTIYFTLFKHEYDVREDSHTFTIIGFQTDELQKYMEGESSYLVDMLDGSRSAITHNRYTFRLSSQVKFTNWTIYINNTISPVNGSKIVLYGYESIGESDLYIFYVGMGWWYPIYYQNRLSYKPAYVKLLFQNNSLNLIPKYVRFYGDIEFYIEDRRQDIKVIDIVNIGDYLIFGMVALLTYALFDRGYRIFAMAVPIFTLITVLAMTGNPKFLIGIFLFSIGWIYLFMKGDV